MTIMAPKDASELEDMLEFALIYEKGPISIRYPKDVAKRMDFKKAQIKLGEPEILREGKDGVIFSLGPLSSVAIDVSKMLEDKGISVKVVNARFVKPVDEKALHEIAGNNKFIFSLEDAALEGGYGSMLQENLSMKITRFGLPDEFIPHGSREKLLDKYNLTSDKIFGMILKIIKNG